MAERIKKCKNCFYGVTIETHEIVKDVLGFPTKVPPGATRQRVCLNKIDVLYKSYPPEEFVSEEAKCVKPERYSSWGWATKKE